MLFYVRPGEVAIDWTNDLAHSQYEAIQAAHQKFKEETDAKGRNLKIHKLELPRQVQLTKKESEEINFDSEAFERTSDNTFIATYVNFYLCNGAIIVPALNNPQDKVAVHRLREIVQVYTREVSVRGGNIHCIKQQKPAI